MGYVLQFGEREQKVIIIIVIINNIMQYIASRKMQDTISQFAY